MWRWVLGALVAGLLNLNLAFAQAAPDSAAQEPAIISTEVVVDPFDQPPPRRDTSVSPDASTGPSTTDPDGLSPNQRQLPTNET